MRAKNVSRAVRNCALKGLAAAIVLFFAIRGIALLPVSDTAVAALHLAALYSILVVAGYTLHRVSVLTKDTHLGGRLYNLGTALGMLISGFGFWQVLAAFKDLQAWPGKDGLIIFSSIIGVAVSRLAGYRGERRGGLWWGIIGWLGERPGVMFLIGVVVALYLVYIRPYLTIDKDILMFIEWFIVCILGFTILIRVWLGVSRNYVSKEPEVDLSRQRPPVERLTGITHDYMIRVERQFVNTGVETGLYVLLIILLYNNRINERDILEVVKPLIDFMDVQEHWYEVTRRQVGWREKVMKSSFDRINTLVQPYRSSMPGSSYRGVKSDAVSYQDDVTLDELKQRFLETGDKAGIFVRLTLLLHKAGRHQEHIVSALQSLIDDRGRLSPEALEALIDNLKRTVNITG